MMAAAGLASVIAGVAVTPASADPIAAKQAQANALAAQIDTLGRKEAALSEQYDKAVLDTQTTAGQQQQAAAELATAQAQEARARGLLQADAVDAYVNGGTLAAVASRTADPVAAADGGLLRGEYVTTLAGTQADALDRYRSAAMQEQAAVAALQAAERASQKAAGDVNSARNATIAADNQLEATLSKVKGDIATLVAQAQAAAQARQAQLAAAALARRQQETQAAAQAQAAQVAAAAQAAASRRAAAPVLEVAPVSPTSGAPAGGTKPTNGGGGGTNGGGAARPAPVPAPVVSTPAPAPVSNPAPPVGSGGSVAVAAAETRLGDPYVWGAAGPNAFDCSGLVMWAWAHAGVSLPHFSGGDYASTQHISMSQLQPGDLVYPADPGQHVAMYVGGGMIIEAPHTGDVVHIVPMGSWYVLASRP
jgi:cell wall-associated NlpC family hydrolase